MRALAGRRVAASYGAGQRGISLAEVLVTMALLATALGMGALYLKPMQAPLRTGGELLEGLFKQARSKAISTTTSHRVVPAGTAGLAVETADSCASGSWTADPRMSLDLPDAVTLIETGWSVCFDNRGVASDNMVLTLQHPKFGSRQLEILRGGFLRWVE